uniref:Uracil phosphoribosyltransferase n=1 Tax=Dermonema virens TaxID=1077399 RepID=A0A1G4NSA4_9FLOR|nr:Uracil phosphoribosyltransferase [Dermonema virens]SCW21446.1 Uracil phosphoribosyltransferase [Dermonema virens]
MSINIYTIKHPLVLHWSSYLSNPSISIGNKNEVSNKVYLALLYEASRRSLDVTRLYIKYFSKTQEISLISRTKCYLFCSDIHISHEINKDAKYLIPNILVKQILLDFENNQWKILKAHSMLPVNLTESQVIILEHQLNTKRLRPVIEYILQCASYDVPIQICCYICKQVELESLSNQYPKLEIYTCIIDDKV